MNEEMGKAFGKYYAYPVTTKTVDIAELAKQMAAYNTGFSSGQVKGMLTDMVKLIKENVLNGFAVKIDDLAIFTCGIVNKEGADDKTKFTVAGNIESVKLRSRATGELMRANLNKEASLMDIEKLANLKTSDDGSTSPTTPTNPSDDKKDDKKDDASQGGGSGSGSTPGSSTGTGSEGGADNME